MVVTWSESSRAFNNCLYLDNMNLERMETRLSLANFIDSPMRKSPSLTSIGFLLHLAQSRLRDLVIEAIEGSGLHPGQLAVLGALSDQGGMSQRRLGELTRIEKSSMVLYLDGLESAGWVLRRRDPRDRRAHIVMLTLKGGRDFAKLGPRLLSAQRRFLQSLSAADVAVLTELLTRLSAPVKNHHKICN
jgi:DNA-binding MarR family transcriptional regulator